jgi:hypothetical protein
MIYFLHIILCYGLVLSAARYSAWSTLHILLKERRLESAGQILFGDRWAPHIFQRAEKMSAELSDGRAADKRKCATLHTWHRSPLLDSQI